MRLNDDFAVLPVEAAGPMGPMVLNLALILDPAGPVLVDAGLPNTAGVLDALLGAEGVKLADLRAVLVTHHDMDHIGGLPAVVAESGAEVLVPDVEVPYVEGRQPPQKQASPEMLEGMLARVPEAQREMVRGTMTRPPAPVPVSRALHAGEVLPYAGGVRVVASPGHTAGHTSYFLERSRVLIAGDALSAENGQIRGPGPQVTADMAEAGRSVRALADLEPGAILCYHGGLVTDDAAGQLRRLAESLG